MLKRKIKLICNVSTQWAHVCGHDVGRGVSGGAGQGLGVSGLVWSSLLLSPHLVTILLALCPHLWAGKSFGSTVGTDCPSPLCPSLLPPPQVLTSRTKIMGPW